MSYFPWKFCFLFLGPIQTTSIPPSVMCSDVHLYWVFYLNNENGNGPAERSPRATVLSPWLGAYFNHHYPEDTLGEVQSAHTMHPFTQGQVFHFKLQARAVVEIGNKITNWDKYSINCDNWAADLSRPVNESKRFSEVTRKWMHCLCFGLSHMCVWNSPLSRM